MLRTFSIQTLGCRVNQYESDQLATLLRSHGLAQVDRGGDLRIVNTCSVTVQAASKSRQTVRRSVRLPVLSNAHGASPAHGLTDTLPEVSSLLDGHRPRVVVTGCWATSNPEEASRLAGVDAVIGHHDDLAFEIDRLLQRWQDNSVGNAHEADLPQAKYSEHQTTEQTVHVAEPAPEPLRDDGSMIRAGVPVPLLANVNKPSLGRSVKKKVAVVGTRALPLLAEQQSNHQRAFLKVQDGCDAHCTYCIIPQLRPSLWSKPIDQVVDEARRLVDAGHREIVLTGIFLGAYGQETALRRRQQIETARPLAQLVDALCTSVPGLRRLRFSSLEPGDLTPDLVSVLRSHAQLVPHFHLPLQSGSDRLLRRMNRQYTRDDFLRMIDCVQGAFDRPALTTDIIVGFPGETDEEFDRTMEVVDRARFIHIHAFSFSPRPGTAAARWEHDFVRGPIVNQRIELLNARAQLHSADFRRQFLGQTVEVLVERQDVNGESNLHHGRCERYFDVWFESDSASAGEAVQLQVTRVTSTRTFGEEAA